MQSDAQSQATKPDGQPVKDAHSRLSGTIISAFYQACADADIVTANALLSALESAFKHIADPSFETRRSSIDQLTQLKLFMLMSSSKPPPYSSAPPPTGPAASLAPAAQSEGHDAFGHEQKPQPARQDDYPAEIPAAQSSDGDAGAAWRAERRMLGLMGASLVGAAMLLGFALS